MNALELALMSAVIKRAVSIADRREHLCRHAPRCVACRDPQVQLVDWGKRPAHWRCRKCGYKFTFEPLKEPGMRIQVSITEEEAKRIIYDHLLKKGIDVDDATAVKFFVKSKQNYKSEWEEAAWKVEVDAVNV